MKQQEWVLTRKKLLKKIKAQVFERLGKPHASLEDYAKHLSGEFRGRWRTVEWDEMIKALTQSDVVFGSDFHAYAQSQRAHVRVLRSLPKDRQVLLALECLCEEDQIFVDAYQAGELSEEAFVEKIDWVNAWGFPWSHYKPIFDLANQRNYLIRGISRKGDAKKSTLATRDERMASDVVELQVSFPEHLIYVMVGELHLADRHLPEAWRVQQGTGHAVTIYQDAEALYFRLAEQARDQKVDVLRNGDRFCLMVSPPWVKWQSYLMYLEQTYDRELDEDGEVIDFSDHLKSFVELLAKDLRMEIDTASLQVFTPASKEALRQLKRHLPKKFWPVLLQHLSNDRSFHLPKKGLVYLSSPTLNRAASMAGEYVHAMISQRQEPLWRGIHEFEGLIWIEAVSFFFSKWINPKRKADQQENLRFQLSMTSPKDRGRKVLLLALDQKMSEVVFLKTGRRRKRRTKARNMIDVLEAAKILGSMLGEEMFLRFREKRFEISELLEWLQYPPQETDFHEFYHRLLKRLK